MIRKIHIKRFMPKFVRKAYIYVNVRHIINIYYIHLIKCFDFIQFVYYITSECCILQQLFRFFLSIIFQLNYFETHSTNKIAVLYRTCI